MAVTAFSQSPSDLAEFTRAARPARLVALLLDSVIYGVILAVANSIYGVTEVTSGPPLSANGTGFIHYSTQTAVPWLAVSLIYILYFAIPEAMFGATPGKALCRLRVIDVGGRPLGLGAIVVRNLLRIVDALPILYLAGGVAVVYTQRSQRIGDLVAGTTVVYRHRVPARSATRHSNATERRYLAVGLAALLMSSAAFDYFGRPPLVVQGAYNTRSGMMDLDSYTLGRPVWAVGSVTYPIQGFKGSTKCTGSIEVDWNGWLFGWELGGGQLSCAPN